MVVDEGDGDGEIQVVDPPNDPPPPPVASQSPWPPICRRPKGGADPLLSPGAAGGVCGGSTCFFLPPPHSHMTVMWIFRRLIRCLVRRKEGEHRGTWGKDASEGGVWVWKPLRGATLAPVPEAISVGALPALNLLFDPRGVRFGTPHYLVLLQHWAQLRLVRQWRQGKAVAFGADWATVVALPRPIYTPGASPRTRAWSPSPAPSRRRRPRPRPNRGPRRPRWPAREPLRPLWRPPVPPRSSGRPWGQCTQAE